MLAFSRPHNKHYQQRHAYGSSCCIAYPSFLLRQMKTFRRNQDIRYGHHGHKQSRHHRHQISKAVRCACCMLLLIEIHRCRPKGEYGQGLVRPCEIAPYDIEIHKRHTKYHGKHRHGNHQAFPDGFLLQMEEIRYDQSCASQSRIARSDGSRDNANHGDDSAYDAEPTAADLIHHQCCDILPLMDSSILLNSEASVALQVGKTERASSCCPDKREDTFGNHSAIEDMSALALGGAASCHQRRLGAVEAR